MRNGKIPEAFFALAREAAEQLASSHDGKLPVQLNGRFTLEECESYVSREFIRVALDDGSFLEIDVAQDRVYVQGISNGPFFFGEGCQPLGKRNFLWVLMVLEEVVDHQIDLYEVTDEHQIRIVNHGRSIVVVHEKPGSDHFCFLVGEQMPPEVQKHVERLITTAA